MRRRSMTSPRTRRSLASKTTWRPCFPKEDRSQDSEEHLLERVCVGVPASVVIAGQQNRRVPGYGLALRLRLPWRTLAKPVTHLPGAGVGAPAAASSERKWKGVWANVCRPFGVCCVAWPPGRCSLGNSTNTRAVRPAPTGAGGARTATAPGPRGQYHRPSALARHCRGVRAGPAPAPS
jgi:hypothetical protein